MGTDTPKLAVVDGKIVPFEKAYIPPNSHSFLYGTAVFEGIRAYLQDSGGVSVFELLPHMQRLERNARMLGFRDFPLAQDLARWTLELLCELEPREDHYIRPVIYLGEGGIGVFPATQKTHSLILATPMARYFPKEVLAVKVSSWVRVSGNTVPPMGKVNGAYVNSYLAVKEAREAGFDEAILLNDRGLVSEGSGENIWLVREGRLVTPGHDSDILDGITRRHVFDLARDLGLSVEVRSISRPELYAAEEIFFSGTGVEITAVGKVDHVTIGDGSIGPITRRIRERFQASVRGRIPQYHSKLTPVGKPK